MTQISYVMDVRPGDCKGAVELTFRITFQQISPAFVRKTPAYGTPIPYPADYEWTRVEIEMRRRPSDPGPVYQDMTDCAAFQELLSVQYEQGNLFAALDDEWRRGEIREAEKV